MPVAEPFSFRPKDGAYPSCIKRVDVLDYNATGEPAERWTTFSGWSEEEEPTDQAAKDESIAESLILASKWYWNTAKLYGSCSHNGNSLGLEAQEITDGVLVGSNAYDDIPEDEKYTQPKERVCIITLTRKYGESEEWGSSTVGQINRQLLALYKGDINDDDNFIGYAASVVSTLGGSQTGFYAQAFAKAGVGLGGILQKELGEENLFREEYAYVEYDGMHFVASAYATEGYDGDATATLDATVPSASSTYDRQDETWTAEAEITGESPLTFFTYP